jgi:hypothetical protein
METIGADDLILGHVEMPYIDEKIFYTIPITEEVKPEWAEWWKFKELNREAELVVYGSVTKKFLDILQICANAREMYYKLEQDFASASSNTR